MKVLIVDDNPTHRKTLRLALEAEGHRTIEAADGSEGLEKLRSTKADAVISDVLMPKMDGYRFCFEVRRSDELREIPMVIYSATYTFPFDEGLATRIGADCFVPPPPPRSPARSSRRLPPPCVRENRAAPRRPWKSSKY